MSTVKKVANAEVVYTVPEAVASLETSFERGGRNYCSAYFYYTTVSSLALMLENGFLRLSNINSARLNDPREPKEFGKKALWDRTCIACFSADRMENNAMWRAYGIPADEAIVLRIPSGIVKSMTNSDIYVATKSGQQKTFALEGPTYPLVGLQKVSRIKVLHHRIAYFPNVIQWEDEEKDVGLNLYRGYELIASLNIHGRSTTELNRLMGYLKRWQWGYEQEARLHVVLPARFTKQDAYLKLPPEFFKKVSIILGPCFDVKKLGVKQTLKEFVERKEFDGHGTPPITESAYSGQLNYPQYGSTDKQRVPSLTFQGRTVSRKSPQGCSVCEQYANILADVSKE